MHDSFVLIEQRIQAEADAAAFRRLPVGRKRLALLLASMGFTGRQKVVGVAGVLIGLTEVLIDYLLIWPYRVLGAGLLYLVDGAERVVKISVSVVTVVTLGGLITGRLILGAAAYAIDVLRRFRIIADNTGARWFAAIAVADALLRDCGRRVAKWGADVKRKVDIAWAHTKAGFRASLRYAGEVFEFYGAIGLFRASKWILDPRLNSGRPLFGHNQVNKVFGIVVAACGFIVFCFILTAVGVFAKFMHAHLAASFVSDDGPVALKIAKQLLYQPLITIGLTAAKFVLLPVIAATRQTLKSTDFTRGVAHAYSIRLRRHRTRKSAESAAAEGNPAAPAAGETLYSMARNLRKVSLGFVEKFVLHLVEKSSPTFYEGRLQYYRKALSVSSRLTRSTTL
jgi:hypothetical protein